MEPEQVLKAIPQQRAMKWPNFHPETYCHLCGRPNIKSWWIGNAEARKLATEDLERGIQTILCPQCFTELWQQKMGIEVSWELRIDPQTVSPKVQRLINLARS